ncbi:MAG: MerR family transcriptional regulator [Saprospiraceae bacterium]
MADLKRYYSIGEVAEIFGVSKSLIRFWETEFDYLRPYKNSKGDRRFTEQNIKQIREIFHLVKERGFTLNGAKNELKLLKKQRKEQEELIKKLQKIRTGLGQIYDKI